MKRFLFALIAVLLCGIVQADDFPVGVVGETESETLYREIQDLTSEILTRAAKLKALVDKPDAPCPDCPPSDPCPACPACPDCPDCPDCDNDDDPPPPPPPTVEGLYPLEINGKQWTFHTAPPKLNVIAHPRFLIPGREGEIRAKLSDPLWSNTMRQLDGSPELQALRYALLGDSTAGQSAKQAVLSLDGEMDKYGDSFLSYVLVYDWCYDLFSAEEKETALRLLLGECGLAMPPPGSAEFGVTYVRHSEKGDGFLDWYGNDVHESRTHSKGVQLRGLVPLAFFGDGVRDEFCEYAVGAMRTGKDNRIYPIYDSTHGGLLDLHNSMALLSGGTQAGGHVTGTITGYNAMFYDSGPRLMAMWETATGDELFSRNNFYKQSAEWIAYRGEPVGGGRGLQVFVMLTGLLNGDDAALSAWVNQQQGDGSYFPIFALTLGDKTVQPKSPEQLGLPLSSFRNGDDRWFSRSNWTPDATTLMLTARTIDSNRYEPDVGLLSITSGREKLLIAGQAKKGGRAVVYGSGVWIWPTGTTPSHSQQSSTYWGAFHLSPDQKVDRATSPYAVATLPGYRGVLPTEDHGEDLHHVFTIDASRFAFDGVKSPMDVRKNKRTVVHLKPVDGREFVVVYDRVNVGDDISQLWGCRVMNQPTVDGQSFTAVNENKSLHGTFLTPVTLEVRGGPGKATEGPNGERYDGNGYDFKDDDSGRAEYGSFALFANPVTPSQQQRYCIVLEIGNTGFTPAAATMADQVVWVHGWRVDFRVEDGTKVSR